MTANKASPHFQDVLTRRLSRRGLLGGLAAMPLLNVAGCATTPARGENARAGLGFASVAATNADKVTVPPGYTPHELISWGDALYENMPTFDPDALTRADQEQRFGANNDMLALFPAAFSFPFDRATDRYILCANHEYADVALMYPGITSPDQFNETHGAAIFASLGATVVEIERVRGQWRVRRDSAPGAGRNRRITPFTPVRYDGPAAQHRWVAAAGGGFRAGEPGTPEGTIPSGTLANCAGGQTPWGTYLTSEENFNYAFFLTDPDTDGLRAARADKAWADACDSFRTPLARAGGSRLAPAHYNVSTVPYGPALYGWVVEIDPYDPGWTPTKHTALGRKKGECATTALTRDGRVAVYMGDDQLDEFVYKFVSSSHFQPANRVANRSLLSEGKLYAAQFDADGSGRWLEINLETARAAAGPQTAPFTDEGDVFIRVREAARLIGATPMDRPEDVEAVLDAQWIGQGPVLVVCTNNSRAHGPRGGAPTREGADGAVPNHAGHIVRIDEEGGDCGAVTFSWDVFVMGGDPDAAGPTQTVAGGAQAFVSVKQNGAPLNTGARFACPDNIFIDGDHVWIATDGSSGVFADCNDSVLVAPTRAAGARDVKRFLVGPVGAEICGPCMSFDRRAFFCAIQHPGEADAAGAEYENLRWRTPGAKPPSSFPDGDGAWPRASVVVVTKDDGGEIGG